MHMKFTGERYIPQEQGAIRVEHCHRYAIAMQFAVGRSVLDLACGEGYGSAMLSQVAHEVIGADISIETIEYARKKYSSQPRLSFECCSAINTNLPNDHFDLVVSFETLEHLAEQDQMLAEIRRVLKPSGLLLISSPNRPVYSGERNYANEFHVKELDFSELSALLNPYFGQIDYYGQRLVMGTVIQPLETHLPFYQAYSDDGSEVAAHSFDLTSPLYYVVLCGPVDCALPSLAASIFIPNSLDLVKHYESFANWAKCQDIELEIRDRNVHHYKNEAEKFERIIHELQYKINAGATYSSFDPSSALVESLETISDLLRITLKQRDQIIQQQNTQLKSLRDELTRSEAQLDLLQDLMFGGRKSERL